MDSYSRGAAPTDKKKWLFCAFVASAVLAVAGAVTLYQQRASNSTDQVARLESTSSFGITYMPVKGKQAESLGVPSGALITEVLSGSPADRAGLKVNDVIVTFKGVALEDSNPLYGMITACPAGSEVSMEVWREQVTKSVTLVNTAW